MSVSSVGQGRALLGTLLRRITAAGTERAAAGHMQGAGNIALQHDSLSFLRHLGIRIRNRA